MTNLYNTARLRIILASKGFAMGVADIIPGVSGGTIAFISGIYTDLIFAITSIKLKHLFDLFSLFSSQKRNQAIKSLLEIEWNFIFTLFAGIIFAILTMAKIIPFFMREFPFYTYSLFFGLIAFSLYIPFKNMKKDFLNYSILGLFACLMFFLMGPSSSLTGSTNIFYIFFSGAIAICAMILPGISGSYILVLLGQYVIILDALHARDLTIILPFICGIATGILSFTRLLKYLLEHHQSTTMAALTGVMLGSLRKVWPGNFTPDSGIDTSMIIASIGFIFFGGILIVSLEYISKTLNVSKGTGAL